MEELIELVSKKTGLSDEMAEKGVAMVAGFLQGQLPSAVSSQVGDVLGTKASATGKRAKTTGDLVELIAKKTGLPEEMAQTLLDVVLGYLKKNLPEPLDGAVELLLSGSGTGLDDLLGGILGQ
jgi:hypothetical protein